MAEIRIDTSPLRGNPVVTGLDTMTGGATYRRLDGLADHVLVYTLGGLGHMGPAQGKVPQPRGRLVVVDPGQCLDQDVAPEDTWKRVWVIFEARAHWYAWMDWPQPIRGYRVLDLEGFETQGRVVEALTAMHRHGVSGVRTGHAMAMNALEAALILANEAGRGPLGAGAGVDARLERALGFIGRGLGGRLTVEAIAQAAHVSPAHLSRLFRGRVGKSVMAYVESQRMARARQLLEMTAQGVSQVAREVGFEDPFYFSTRFRRAVGVSPVAYRKRLRGA